MVETITAGTLERLLASDASVQIVDVRHPAQFETGHLPRSENVPFEQLLADVGAHEWGERIVFVCPYGERSRQAAELLRAYEDLEDDVEIYNLEPGLQGWDGPLVTTADAEGE